MEWPKIWGVGRNCSDWLQRGVGRNVRFIVYGSSLPYFMLVELLQKPGILKGRLNRELSVRTRAGLEQHA